MAVNLLVAVVSYLLGSIDFAVLVGRRRGVDIYAVGSGNPGASNVMRSVGRRSAALVLVGDAAKGALAAGLGLLVGGQVLAAAAGFFAVLGHIFPIFHRFRGGKGMATAAGMMLVAFPIPALILIALWAALVAATKVSSIGSVVVMLVAVPLLVLFGVSPQALPWVGATALLVIYRHGDNLRRLAQGQEATVTSHGS